MQWSAVTWRSAHPIQAGGSQNTTGTVEARTSGVQQDVASGAAGGFIGRHACPLAASWSSLLLLCMASCGAVVEGLVSDLQG